MISLSHLRTLCKRHISFIGPGLVSSVAYIDPGNWATDLQAGALYGYKLLFIVLLAGLAAVVLQLLSVRLGAVSGRSLATNTRLLFERLQVKYPRWRLGWKLGLWTLYGLAEIAVVACDLAELIGSAVALNLLFPRLPLWAGVLITAFDVLIILIFFSSSSGRRGMLFFEILIVTLVLAVFISFMILLHLIHPSWPDVFYGLIPSHTLVEPGALYVGVGIIGATVMPHALFLGSELAGVDRLGMVPRPPEPLKQTFKIPKFTFGGIRRRLTAKSFREPEIENVSIPRQPGGHLDLSSQPISPTMRNIESMESIEGFSRFSTLEDEEEKKKYEIKLRSFDRIKWVDIHLFHTAIDTTLSLLGFALTINAAILTLAGAVYFYGTSGIPASDADLQGAHDIINDYIGKAPAIIFALALLCAGQSASITATLAGQVVSEGFINWHTPPFARRLITRLIGVVPAAIVAAAIGPKGLNTMLVASQVVLSIVLPTVIFPLVFLCSKEDVMTVLGPINSDHPDQIYTKSPSLPSSSTKPSKPDSVTLPSPTPIYPTQSIDILTETTTENSVEGLSQEEIQPVSSPRPAIEPSSSDVKDDPGVEITVTDIERKEKSYKSPIWVTILGYFLFGVVVVANVYVIVELGLGQD
ncbi:metal iron transporter [Tremella mesenterica]|uniref:Metal iron transporter n=1 Tax=Tremella mesenterica TaxID=5217 RepID=A0A4Q1BTN3_TREME|nr:metal iron transporter [Tremella mesenterica]